MTTTNETPLKDALLLALRQKTDRSETWRVEDLEDALKLIGRLERLCRQQNEALVEAGVLPTPPEEKIVRRIRALLSKSGGNG